MDSFEFNKIAGGILASLLLIYLISMLGDVLMHPTLPENVAYPLPEMEAAEKPAASTEEAPEGPSLAALMAEGNAETGAKVARKCAACHTFDNGGKNKVGPNLFGVVGAAKARLDNFKYSSALKEAGGDWTFDDLDAFLTKPKTFITGNKMTFPGLSKPADRANVLVFMNSNSASPLPMPSE